MAVQDHSIGVVLESNYGVPVTPVTRFFDFLEGGGMMVEPGIVRSKAMRAGRRTLAAEMSGRTKPNLPGKFVLEPLTKSYGLLWRFLFGTVATAGPTNGKYTHTFTLGATEPPSFTLQQVIGRTGTNMPFTFTGTKITDAVISGDMGEFVKVEANLDARDYWQLRTVTGTLTTGQPTVTTIASTVGLRAGMPITGTGIPASTTILAVTGPTTITLSANATASGAQTLTCGTTAASPSYPTTTEPFLTDSVTVTVGGQTACFSGFELSIDHTLKTDRKKMCNGGLKDEPVRAEYGVYSLTLQGLEYTANTLLDQMLSDTAAGAQAQVVITCIGQADPTATMVITIPACELVGDFPSIDAMLVEMDLTFDVLAPAAGGSEITLAYTTTDITP